MNVLWTILLSLATFLWAADTQVTYKDTVATPKQSVVAIKVLAEGMQALKKGAASVVEKDGKITITINKKELNQINAMVGRISNTTSGKDRKDNKSKYKKYIKYVNQVSKANHYIKGNRKKVASASAQVCVDLGLTDVPSLDIETPDLAQYRWENEVAAADMYESVTYNGDIHLAQQILSHNMDIFEDDEYFYPLDVYIKNGKLFLDVHYFDDQNDVITTEITQGEPCAENVDL